jgi:hypothetical protein
MIVGHPGQWQHFIIRSDNRGLSVMEMKQKYLKEQLMYEQSMSHINQLVQQRELQAQSAQTKGKPKEAPATGTTPTPSPTAAPTSAPTAAPTTAPTPSPTAAPTAAPTIAPTPAPVVQSQPIVSTIIESNADNACERLFGEMYQSGNLYIQSGSLVQTGTYVYTDSNLTIPAPYGWFAYPETGFYYLVSGSNGEIVSSGSCG